MNATRLLVVVVVACCAAPAVAQVMRPRQALGEAPAPGDAAFYVTMTPVEPYRRASCSPSRVSTSFSSAIKTSAARAWDVRLGADTYAIIWRRGHDSYRAVQLVESRAGKVRQKTIGKHMYRTKQEAADAIAAQVQRRLEDDAPPQLVLAGHRPNLDMAWRARPAR